MEVVFECEYVIMPLRIMLFCVHHLKYMNFKNIKIFERDQSMFCYIVFVHMFVFCSRVHFNSFKPGAGEQLFLQAIIIHFRLILNKRTHGEPCDKS